MKKRICSYSYASNFEQYRDDVWMYTPSTARDEEYQRLVSSFCRYCGEKLRTDIISEQKATIIKASVCAACGYWFLKKVVVGGQDSSHVRLTIGEVQHYEISSREIPIVDLRRYLRQNPTDVAHVNPFAFEKLIAECFKSHFGPCEVIHIGGIKDRGIDLKLVRSDGGTTLVQIKRRSDLSKKEGVDVVRQLNGVLFREGEAKGIIVTTASGYTREATSETQINTHTTDKYQMDLLAFGDVAEMLMLPDVTPYEPWLDHVNSNADT